MIYSWNNTDFAGLTLDGGRPILGLYESSHMKYEHDHTGDPSLAEITGTAITHLSNNGIGYYLMVEAGRVDHANHAGNAHRTVTDVEAFAQAVAKAVEMTSAEDTLTIVTADHEHAIAFNGYCGRGSSITGVCYDVDPQDAMDPDYVQQALIPKSSETHSGEDVANYALASKYTRNNVMAVFLGTVLARLFGLTGDVRQAMSLMATLSQVLVAAGVLAGLLVVGALLALHPIYALASDRAHGDASKAETHEPHPQKGAHEQDHEDGVHAAHDRHLAEGGHLRALHAWTQATKGKTALVFVEIENIGDSELVLEGATAPFAAGAELVAFSLVDGE